MDHRNTLPATQFDGLFPLFSRAMTLKAAAREAATRTQVERLERRISQFQARRALVLARQREVERKRDTRCKILLGAGLLTLVRAGDGPARELYRRIRAAIPERPARAFEGWKGEPKEEPAGDTGGEGSAGAT